MTSIKTTLPFARLIQNARNPDRGCHFAPFSFLISKKTTTTRRSPNNLKQNSHCSSFVVSSITPPSIYSNKQQHPSVVVFVFCCRKKNMPVSRRQIVRACKGRGWQIQPDALKGLEDHLGRHNDGDFLDQLGEYMKDSSNKTLTKAIWEQFVQDQESSSLRANNNNNSSLQTSDKNSSRPKATLTTSSSNSPWSDLQVVSAFHDVKLVYHTMKKHFRTEEQPWSLFGKAEDKVRPFTLALQVFLELFECLTHFSLLVRHDRFKCTCSAMP